MPNVLAVVGRNARRGVPTIHRCHAPPLSLGALREWIPYAIKRALAVNPCRALLADQIRPERFQNDRA
jgi:hypothetical protein